MIAFLSYLALVFNLLYSMSYHSKSRFYVGPKTMLLRPLLSWERVCKSLIYNYITQKGVNYKTHFVIYCKCVKLIMFNVHCFGLTLSNNTPETENYRMLYYNLICTVNDLREDNTYNKWNSKFSGEYPFSRPCFCHE